MDQFKSSQTLNSVSSEVICQKVREVLSSWSEEWCLGCVQFNCAVYKCSYILLYGIYAAGFPQIII